MTKMTEQEKADRKLQHKWNVLKDYLSETAAAEKLGRPLEFFKKANKVNKDEDSWKGGGKTKDLFDTIDKTKTVIFDFDGTETKVSVYYFLEAVSKQVMEPEGISYIKTKRETSNNGNN